ncbi:MAG: putative DNA binding domain-containing protein [Proteobacteria bacterium]|nr:putative DNA binding domain-containing protein [Pseudomonadota bacterium]
MIVRTDADLRQAMQLDSESEHVEFKEAKNNFHFEDLADYCCALANEGGGSIVLGVTDVKPRSVVGTKAFTSPDRTKIGLFERLHWRVEVAEIVTQEGRVLSFIVPGRPPGRPLNCKGRYLMRAGSSLQPMSVEQISTILGEAQVDFSADVVPGADASIFDADAIAEFRARWERKSNRAEIAQWSTAELLENAEITIDGDPTYAGLILLGTEKALVRYLAHAEVIFEYRSSEANIAYQQRHEYRRGFFSWVDDIWATINLRNEVQQFREGLFKYDISTFDEDSVREAVLNAICHRDYRDAGSVWIRQYPRLLEIESPGGLPEGISQNNILFRQKPRNRRIAEALAKCGLVERSGQGMDLMFKQSIRQGKPLPDLAKSDAHAVVVRLLGEVGDPRFLRFLEQIGDERLGHFSTDDFLIIDLVHRGEPISDHLKERVNGLVDSGAVERSGRGKVILSRKFYTFLGEPGVHTRKAGLDRETEKELLLKHLKAAGDEGAPMAELLQVLKDRSRGHVKGLMNELRGEGRARNAGPTKAGRWFQGASHK